MGKSCCAVGCTNRYSKTSRIPFYCFPTDPEGRHQWIAAVDRNNWLPTEHSWICGARFISGCKGNDCVCPEYVPSIFNHVKSPKKRKLVEDMERYKRMACTKKRRIDNSERTSAAWSLLELEMAQIFVNHTLAPPLLHLFPCVILKTWNVDTITWKMKTDDY